MVCSTSLLVRFQKIVTLLITVIQTTRPTKELIKTATIECVARIIQ
jgi:hypothetical protein